MTLSDTQIRNAKPGVTPRGNETTKPYKMGDTGDLYLEVSPKGGKWWRLKYRFDGKQKQWDGLLLPLIGIAMCQTDSAKQSVKR